MQGAASARAVNTALNLKKAADAIKAGQGAGNGVTYTNTHVAGSTVNIDSGGDTMLKGAVVKDEGCGWMSAKFSLRRVRARGFLPSDEAVISPPPPNAKAM